MSVSSGRSSSGGAAGGARSSARSSNRSAKSSSSPARKRGNAGRSASGQSSSSPKTTARQSAGRSQSAARRTASSRSASPRKAGRQTAASRNGRATTPSASQNGSAANHAGRGAIVRIGVPAVTGAVGIAGGVLLGRTALQPQSKGAGNGVARQGRPWWRDPADRRGGQAVREARQRGPQRRDGGTQRARKGRADRQGARLTDRGVVAGIRHEDTRRIRGARRG